jgi:hypothetical protein
MIWNDFQKIKDLAEKLFFTRSLSIINEDQDELAVFKKNISGTKAKFVLVLINRCTVNKFIILAY